MTTANFNQPSTGTVTAPGNALTVENNGAGRALAVQGKLNDGAVGETPADGKAGVIGISAGRFGFGVIGQAKGGPGKGETLAVGVLGDAPDGVGVFGTSERLIGVQGTSQGGPGVQGETQSGAAGVAGVNTAVGPGVSGQSVGGPGVTGVTTAQGIAGVVGQHDADGDGVSGSTTGQFPQAGVVGTASSGGIGVKGTSNQGPGVVGAGNGTSALLAELGGGAGVIGVGSTGEGGVFGINSNTANQPGVTGLGTPGLFGFGGVYCLGSPAGGFLGDVEIIGNLTVSGGSKQFVIDHPLDPERRLLTHAAVEAPSLKTFYDGIAEADDKGEAAVELPAWFGALNTGLCYQLTAIGAAAPGLHVAQEYDGTAFRIGGANARGRVSWQVTGVRRDASALAHPLKVEQEKAPDEQGRFVDPAAAGPGAQHMPRAAAILDRMTELEHRRQAAERAASE
jgi:hypothetical protein